MGKKARHGSRTKEHLCLFPRRLSFFEGQERAKDKGKGERREGLRLAPLSHGPSRFKLVTSRARPTSPFVGRSKRLRRRQGTFAFCLRSFWVSLWTVESEVRE